MKLKECTLCNLHKAREHTSFSRGHKPSSVLILFDREPMTMRGLDALQEFIRKLNYHLKHDYYYSFLIKCACDEDISSDNIKACRRWFRKEFEKVDPYLIIMMGKYSTAACLGGKYYKLLQENIFYTKTGEDGIKRQYFVGADINASESRLKENLNYLERFIKDFYNAS